MTDVEPPTADRGREAPRAPRGAVFGLVGVCVGLIGWGVARVPPPPGRIVCVTGPRESEGVLAMRPPGSSGGPWLFAITGREGRLRGVSALDLPDGAFLSSKGRLLHLSAEGTTELRLVEEPPTAFARVEADRFRRIDLGGVPLAATKGERRIAVVVALPTGGVGLVLLEGVLPRPIDLPWPADGEGGVAAAAASLGEGAFLVALSTPREVRRLRVTPSGASEAGRFVAAEGTLLRGVAFVSGPEGPALRVLWTEGDDAVLAALEEDGAGEAETGPLTPVIVARLADAGDARLVGPACSRPDAVWVAHGDRLHRVEDGRAPREETSSFLAAWAGRWTRFMEPFLLQLALFGLCGALLVLGGRSTPGSEPDGEAGLVVFPLASLGRRSGALLVDLALVFLVWSPMALLAFGPAVRAYVEQAALSGQVADPRLDPVLFPLFADVFYLYLTLLLAYAAVFEARFGRTLGKRLFGLRVVPGRAGGGPLGRALTRSAFLFVDLFLTQGWLGGLLVLFTRNRSRLGDLVAGTRVVRDRPVVLYGPERGERGPP